MLLSAVSEPWIDLGIEGDEMCLSGQFIAPDIGSVLEVGLQADGNERLSFGVDYLGHLSLTVYESTKYGKVLEVGKKYSFLLKVIAHAQGNDEAFLRVLPAEDDRGILEEPSHSQVWSLVNSSGTTAANLDGIVVRCREYSSFEKLRVAKVVADLPSSAVLAAEDIELVDVPLVHVPTFDFQAPDPVNAPGSQLMLNLPGYATDPARIDYDQLPILPGEHVTINAGDLTWKFRLHSYLAYFDGQFWCMWSHGPEIEDLPTQHVKFATSVDGLSWSDPLDIIPESERFHYIARGFWIRNGQLIALAARREPALSQDLVGFLWESGKKSWNPLGRLYRDALTNYPPQKIPTGEWMVSRRDSFRAVSFLVGGLDSPSDWRDVPFSTYEGNEGSQLEEPNWWVQPDGNLVALFRDNSDSYRLMRAFSTDDGATWSTPVRTNFPDATSKIYSHLTSSGVRVLVSNPNPEGRNPLCLSVSKDGLVFTGMAKLPIPGTGTFQYPHIVEKDGFLWIVYSRNKADIEVIKVPLTAINELTEQYSEGKKVFIH
jgi:hypothetical protein